MKLLKNDLATDSILAQTCDSGHRFEEFVPSVGTKYFNIFAKNIVSEMNDKIHTSRKRGGNPAIGKDQRKITKLQSDKTK